MNCRGVLPQLGKEAKTEIKFDVIPQYRSEYPIQVMRAFFGVSRSGYYRYIQHLDTPKKDAGVAEMIRQCHRECGICPSNVGNLYKFCCGHLPTLVH